MIEGHEHEIFKRALCCIYNNFCERYFGGGDAVFSHVVDFVEDAFFVTARFCVVVVDDGAVGSVGFDEAGIDDFLAEFLVFGILKEAIRNSIQQEFATGGGADVGVESSSVKCAGFAVFGGLVESDAFSGALTREDSVGFVFLGGRGGGAGDLATEDGDDLVIKGEGAEHFVEPMFVSRDSVLGEVDHIFALADFGGPLASFTMVEVGFFDGDEFEVGVFFDVAFNDFRGVVRRFAVGD